MKKVLLYLWQLPQNLVGLATIMITGALPHTYATHKGFIRCYATHKIRSSVSLGAYIIIKASKQQTFGTILHEYGHQKQSLYLGWLYLPIIGVCSGMHNLLYKSDSGISYYDFWTERWADKLGNVKR